MKTLSGKHAVVTGAGSGVGAAIATAFHKAGAAVTIGGRTTDALSARIEALDSDQDRMAGYRLDVTDQTSVADFFNAANDKFGPAQIIVANAGIARSGPFESTTMDDWDSQISTNLTGVFHTFQHGLRQMQDRSWGRLIAVASTAGLKGYAYVAPYVASKHGVVGLVRALAQEFARTGVTSNAICPGYVDTPLLDRAVADICAATGKSAEDARSLLRSSSPQNRFVTPSEVAQAALWLVQEGSNTVNGQAISLSGGEI